MPFGSFELERMPFGLTSTASDLQWFTHEVRRGLENEYAYLKDISIASHVNE